MTPLRIEAPAKLNLTLRVVGRREDGFHLLESDLVLLELADRLLLSPGCSGLRVDGEAAVGVPLDGTNLAWRGLVAGLGGEPELACLALEKVVPARSGLGGGSSDAAAAWRLGRRFEGGDDSPSATDLVDLSAIGADVPFFASGLAAARVSGIGERVEPSPAIDRHVVLASPPFGLATGAIFAELRTEEWGTLDNDLLGPVRRLRPEIDDVFAIIAGAGGHPALTGSGSTVFSLHERPDEAAPVADALARAGVRATITRTRRAAAAIEAIDQED